MVLAGFYFLLCPVFRSFQFFSMKKVSTNVRNRRLPSFTGFSSALSSFFSVALVDLFISAFGLIEFCFSNQIGYHEQQEKKLT